jgi:hypothetical protein
MKIKTEGGIKISNYATALGNGSVLVCVCVCVCGGEGGCLYIDGCRTWH